MLSELRPKVAAAAKAAALGDVGDGKLCLEEQLACHLQPDVLQVVRGGGVQAGAKAAVTFPFAAKRRSCDVGHRELFGSMSRHEQDHLLHLVAGSAAFRCGRGKLRQLLHKGQPHFAQQSLQPQLVAKGILVQIQALAQQVQRCRLSGHLRRKGQQFQPGPLHQRGDMALLHRAARHTGQEFRLEQMQPEGGAVFQRLGAVQHVAVHHAAAARPEQPLPAGRMVDEGTLLHIEQLHAFVPVPGAGPGGAVRQQHMAADVGELCREPGQAFFLTAGVEVDV